MLNKFEVKMGFLQKSLQGLNKRNDLLASNIANLDTPGYKSKDLNFEQTMKRHLSTNKNGLTTVKQNNSMFSQFSIKDKVGLNEDITGNNVDVDKEMVALTENKMKHDLVVEAVRSNLKLYNIIVDSSRG
ncbi:MAG: flagellar basal body rod protein FlgB [Clostridia bacterium]